MTTIHIPPDLEGRLVDEARRLGTTPELLAVEGLRQLFSLPLAGNGYDGQGTLLDFLGGHVGAVSGTNEPISENCGNRFTDTLVEKQRRGSR